MNRLSPLRLLVAVLFIAALAVGGVAAWYYRWGPGAGPRNVELPRPGSPLHEEYTEDFEIGVAAVDANQFDLAKKHLDQAIEKVPQEPAAWANRGLLYLRINDKAQAQADLQKAHELAPDSAEIDILRGLLANEKGRYSEAVELLRKGIERRPEDAADRFVLADILERESNPDSKAEIVRLMDEILKVQPDNLFVLRRKALTALAGREEAAFRAVLNRFEKLSPRWNHLSQEELAKLKKLAEKGLNNETFSQMRILGNVLQAEPGFSRQANAVNRGPTLGETIPHFLRLEPLGPLPSPADLQMSFTAETLPGPKQKAGWSLLGAVWLRQESGPVILAADGKEVRRIDAAGLELRFPGGAKKTPPTPDGVVALDWNNDSRTDLVLAGAGGLRFYEQAADGSFSDVSEKTRLDKTVLEGDYHGAWAADVEMDGDLDVIVAPRHKGPFVLRNNGDGTFKVVRPFSNLEAARAFVWADLDNDGAPDAALLDEQGQLHVYANERGSQVSRRSSPEKLGKLLALTAGDVSDDGVLDLVGLRSDGTVVRISDQNKGRGWDVADMVRWSDMPSGHSPGDSRLFLADLDNNGSLDLVAAASDGTRIWLSERKDQWAALPPPPQGQVFSIADLSKDGRLDLLALSRDGKALQLVNHGTKDYHWQLVKAHADRRGVATPDDRINSFAIGGEIEVRTGTLVQKQIITAPAVHFGLGEKKRANLVRFLWPNGYSQIEFVKDADQVVETDQRLGHSCPFLFTYDGKGMQFVTDFCWSTPLGLNINGQHKSSFTQTEEWIKVRGDQLVPRDGYYDVRFTANLWETHFYDYLSLRVVDHPEGTEMFVDERFALTPLPLQVHLTTPPRAVARAWDEKGKDVTDLVRNSDGRYLDTFERGRYQGIARDHWVEVELGDDIPGDGPLWLVARGWLRPTDSSINLAISQGQHEQPQPLVLEVPDGKGGWKVEQPGLGFPAGKNKTMLIRLDQAPGKGVIRRFRLRTNLEVYWDSLAYARGLDAGQARQQQLAPDSAELRYLGFLQMTTADNSSPELPHYDKLVGTAPRWRDLIGFYTRFGDVRELLAKTDDRYVIMNAGDEVRLRFPAPPGPPAGWRRDFVWVSDGWTKDGNLNTGFSKTVLPLPFHGMKSYDRPPGLLEDDPVYQRFPEDWRTYHTRYVTPDVYEQGLRSFRRPRP